MSKLTRGDVICIGLVLLALVNLTLSFVTYNGQVIEQTEIQRVR